MAKVKIEQIVDYLSSEIRPRSRPACCRRAEKAAVT